MLLAESIRQPRPQNGTFVSEQALRTKNIGPNRLRSRLFFCEVGDFWEPILRQRVVLSPPPVCHTYEKRVPLRWGPSFVVCCRAVLSSLSLKGKRPPSFWTALFAVGVMWIAHTTSNSAVTEEGETKPCCEKACCPPSSHLVDFLVSREPCHKRVLLLESAESSLVRPGKIVGQLNASN